MGLSNLVVPQASTRKKGHRFLLHTKAGYVWTALGLDYLWPLSSHCSESSEPPPWDES